MRKYCHTNNSVCLRYVNTRTVLSYWLCHDILVTIIRQYKYTVLAAVVIWLRIKLNLKALLIELSCTFCLYKFFVYLLMICSLLVLKSISIIFLSAHIYITDVVVLVKKSPEKVIIYRWHLELYINAKLYLYDNK
jgi:hypothetical protein